MKEIKEKDNFVAYFSSTDNGLLDMQEFLAEMVEKSSWEEIKLDEIQAKNITAGPLLISSVKSELNLEPDVSTEALLTTADPENYDGSKFAIEYAGKDYLLSKTGFATVVARLGADSSRFSKLFDSDKQSVLNCYTKIARTHGKGLKRFGKIRAVNGPNYSILPQDKLVDTLIDVLDKKYDGYKFNGGEYTHDYTLAEFTLPEQKAILDVYQEECKKIGFISAKDYIPAVMFSTSDVGDSSASVACKLYNEKNPSYSINLGSPIRLIHANGATVEDFSNKVDGMFALFEAKVGELANLLKIRVNFPVNTAIALGKKAALSKPALRDSIEIFESTHSKDDETTAHDVFYILQNALYNMRCSKKISETAVFNGEENVARLLSPSFDWSSEDSAVRPDL